MNRRINIETVSSYNKRMKPKPDCIHYVGDRPCRHGRLCTDCEHYETARERILIIKTAAVGDVLRTTSLLPALTKAHPGAAVAWLTSPQAEPLLLNNRLIYRIYRLDPFAPTALKPQKFDLLINLDKEPVPCALASTLDARRREGVLMSPHGTPVPANDRSVPYFALGLSDELKFRRNTKSYHRLICEAVGLEYRGEKPSLFLDRSESDYGAAWLRRLGAGAGDTVIGVNTGAGESFAPKMTGAGGLAKLIVRLAERFPRARLLLLGGPREAELNGRLALTLDGLAADAGCGHTLRGFAGIVAGCDAVVTGDTLALHVAVALGVPVVALFGPTCEQEIDLFGRGVKLVSSAACAPCYRRSCSVEPYCMDLIPAEKIADAVKTALKKKRAKKPE
ncbi:MAG: glycosyltransferase family 9 protein [bacterium]